VFEWVLVVNLPGSLQLIEYRVQVTKFVVAGLGASAFIYTDGAISGEGIGGEL